MTEPRYSIEIILYDDEDKEKPIIGDQTFYLENRVFAISLFDVIEDLLDTLIRFGVTHNSRITSDTEG